MSKWYNKEKIRITQEDIIFDIMFDKVKELHKSKNRRGRPKLIDPSCVKLVFDKDGCESLEYITDYCN